MLVAAPAFVSFVQRKEQTITVFVLGQPESTGPQPEPYLISVPASPATVVFTKDPAMTSGLYFKATAMENHYVGISKTVVLFPRRGIGTNNREQWNDTIYAPVSDPGLRKIAGQLEQAGFSQLPETSVDPFWIGEGTSFHVWMVVDGKEGSASYEGFDRSKSPEALLMAVRLIFATGGSPSLPELSKGR